MYPRKRYKNVNNINNNDSIKKYFLEIKIKQINEK